MKEPLPGFSLIQGFVGRAVLRTVQEERRGTKLVWAVRAPLSRCSSIGPRLYPWICPVSRETACALTRWTLKPVVM